MHNGGEPHAMAWIFPRLDFHLLYYVLMPHVHIFSVFSFPIKIKPTFTVRNHTFTPSARGVFSAASSPSPALLCLNTLPLGATGGTKK